MKIQACNKPVLAILILSLFWSCQRDSQWKGQEAIQKVNTETVPIQLQYKGSFDLGQGIFVSNEFEGARLNGIARINDTLLSVLITPENTPINASPWYAFKIWSETKRKVYVKLTYPEKVRHRYYPKISLDGLKWFPLDSSSYKESQMMEDEGMQVPKEVILKLSIGPDTTWIAAQELNTSGILESWMSNLERRPFVSKSQLGKSVEGRPIHLLRIGESTDSKMILVLSGQHPPEATGVQAMKAFVETLCSDAEVAKSFRKEFTAYVVPLANPDGVHHGHWRHNGGGVDLNRDWADFNQPETAAIRDFMNQKASTGNTFYFAVDFHSTWKDIYYIMDPDMKGNMPGIVEAMILETAREFEDYTPNIKPSIDSHSRVSSTSFFFYEFGAESLTFEIGDHTSREFVQKKGEVSAMKLMDLMLEQL